MSSLNLRGRQLDLLSRLLTLERSANGTEEPRASWHDPWKVLVYDAFCRDVISTLLNIGDLRKRGVTLHLLIDSPREPIPDVPAVYLVQPTEQNVRRIAEDCAATLYDGFYLNFTPSIPRPLLETLAMHTLGSESVASIACVTDQYLNFSSLEDDFFSLQLPGRYSTLNAVSSTDAQIEAAVDSTVSGLFSVVAALGVVPVLRFPRRGPAQMVAEQLGRTLHDRLRAGPHAALFASDSAAAALQRPLLIILERDSELGVMLQHGWTYSALCHDLLDLRLNRVVITEEQEGGRKTQQTHDLGASDTFWAEHGGSAFTVVTSDLDRDLNEYRAAMDEINKADPGAADADGIAGGAIRALQSTINALPELKEKKRLIDVHMNIATELLNHIKARSLDEFYALEESIMEHRTLSREERNTLRTLLTEHGTHDDKLRLLMLLTLHPNQGAPAEVLSKSEASLREAGVDLSPLVGLRARQASVESADASRGTDASATRSGTGFGSGLMQFADKVGVGNSARGVGLALAAGVKQLMPSRRVTPVTRAAATLMDNKGGVDDEAFGFIDPKISPADTGPGASGRSRASYSQAIVFIVGPGNYLEYQALRSSVTGQPTASRKVLYGCTEVLTPNEFLQQMAPR